MAICQRCGTNFRDELATGMCLSCLVRLARDAGARKTGSRQEELLSPRELSSRIPGLEFSECIDMGGIETVYRAHQVDLDRPVAVEVLFEALAEDPTFVERFRREARAMAKIAPPSIVQVFGSGVSNGLCYLVGQNINRSHAARLAFWGHGSQYCAATSAGGDGVDLRLVRQRRKNRKTKSHASRH